ncbi:MAG: hypothetical protein WC082_13370, partial [Victivallales bacterium]
MEKSAKQNKCSERKNCLESRGQLHTYTKLLLCLNMMLMAGLASFGKEINAQPFAFKLSDSQAKVTAFNEKAPFEVNFNGYVDDKERPGKKLYKFDVTFTGFSHNIIFGIPFSMPITDKVTSRFTYSVKAPKGTFGLGFLLKMVPGFSGYVVKRPVESNGKWNTVEINDVFEHCQKHGLKVIANKYYRDVEAENLTPYFTDICLYLKGYKGQRFIVYFRDIEVAGKAPSPNDMKKIIAARWAPAGEKLKRKIRTWQKQLENARAKTGGEKLTSGYANDLKNLILKKINRCSTRVAIASKCGFIRCMPEKQLVADINELAGVDLRSIDKYMQGEKKSCYMPFIVNPVSDRKILPDSILISGKCGSRLEMTATPGEFEPASFVIRAARDLKGIIAAPTALKNSGSGGSLPAACLDIKLVKCWYQGGTAWKSTSGSLYKVMVPELLLNDDSLVKADTVKKENYLKLVLNNKAEYVWISNSNEKSDKPYKLLRTEDFPVKDSPKLLPVNIPDGKNQQFWVTVKVPADALPGDYQGKINLLQSGRNIGAFTLSLKVLPFKLLPPYYTSSIYYRGQLSDKYPEGTVSSEYKSEKQLEAELKNMVDHGVTNPLCYQLFSNRKLFKKYLDLRKLAGMDSNVFYGCYAVFIGVADTPELKANLKNQVSSAIEFLKEYGINSVYFYGRDEAKREKLAEQRETWEVVHNLGGKVFSAGYTAQQHPPGNFAVMGDIQDLFVCGGKPMVEEAANWHSKGHKIWCYANPQSGVENPAVYRRNYGILLWQNDYDGACTFAYHQSYGNIWNDFDG